MSDKYYGQVLKLYISHFILTKTGYSHIHLSALDILSEVYEMVFLHYADNIIDIPAEEILDILPLNSMEILGNEPKEEVGEERQHEVDGEVKKGEETILNTNNTNSLGITTQKKTNSNPFITFSKVSEISNNIGLALKSKKEELQNIITHQNNKNNENDRVLEALCSRLPKKPIWTGRLLGKVQFFYPNPPSVKRVVQKQSSTLTSPINVSEKGDNLNASSEMMVVDHNDGSDDIIKQNSLVDKEKVPLQGGGPPTTNKIKIRFTIPKVGV